MATSNPAFPETAEHATGASGNPAPAKDVTGALAHYLVTATYDDLPGNVRKEGARTLLNWVGVAIAGSRHQTVEIAVAALTPFSGPAQASLFGRRERVDIMNAAFINGVSSHIFDFDDTHLKTIIHPAGLVASAILALSEMHPVSGKDFLNALVLGVETECRIGNAVYPNHYDVGWHITGTAGVFGSAAAVGKLLNLNHQQMVWAIGLAASQPVGLRESFGSMNKSFNPGRAARNGIFAALLASKNFTSSDHMIEAKRGWANTVSTKQDYGEILDGLGSRYEALLNTYKPFACGIVMHPAIDAVIQLRNENRLTADQIERVDLKVHPLVLELTGKKTPQIGLEGKFSVYHAFAVALVEGAGGEKQFSDRAVNDPTVVALRSKVLPVVTPGIDPAQVDMTIVLKDGRTLHRFIAHAIGSIELPMTDKQLEDKFADLAGSKERATAADEFLNWALAKLGVKHEATSASAKGEAIVEALMKRRTLLVLDGVEPLQHGPGPQAGQLKDQGLRALLRRFAAAPPGADHSLIVLTSRLAVADIQRFRNGAAPVVDVERLSDEAGAELLRDNDVWGVDRDLRAASHDFGGHPLALTLLASYLSETQNGDVRRRDHIRGLLADADNPLYDQARRVMESYEREWLAGQPFLLAILHRVGLFDRPASGDCLKALRARPAIPDLTDALVGLRDDQWRRAVTRLREARLLAPFDPSDPEALDAHPLVREWFGERLRQTNEAAWKAAHSRLYDHLRRTTREGKTPTLADLAPLYHAVVHGCRAGRQQKALGLASRARLSKASTASISRGERQDQT